MTVEVVFMVKKRRVGVAVEKEYVYIRGELEIDCLDRL